MSYKPSVYIKAKSILESRRSSAEREQQLRRAIAITKCPEILEIEQEMASYGAEVIKLIGHGKDSTKEIKKLSEKSHDVQAKRKELLKEAGFSEDYLETKYFCSICNDTGYHDGYYCKCHKDLILQVARESLCSIRLLDASGFDNFSLDYYSDEIDESKGISPRKHMEDVVKICKQYVDNFNKHSNGLFFFGKTGLGKTHLSLAIADQITKKGYNVVYTTVQNAMNKIEHEHFGKVKNDEESIVDELCEADLLVLDDLGAEFVNSFTVPQLYNIINSRIIEGKPTIINTNLMIDEVESKYTQRVASRIIGSFTPVFFFGKDIRQLKYMK